MRTLASPKRLSMNIRILVAAVGLTVGVAGQSNEAKADFAGIGSWLPGSFGSLAATPLQPGWGLGLIYLHSDSTAGGDVAAQRAIRFGSRTTNLTVNLDAELKAVL